MLIPILTNLAVSKLGISFFRTVDNYLLQKFVPKLLSVAHALFWLHQTSISERCALVSPLSPPVVSIMRWTAAESVWRQASSDRHPSWTLPNWSTQEHMRRGKHVHIFHQLCPVSAIKNMQCVQHTHISFFHDSGSLLRSSSEFVSTSVWITEETINGDLYFKCRICNGEIWLSV